MINLRDVEGIFFENDLILCRRTCKNLMESLRIGIGDMISFNAKVRMIEKNQFVVRVDYQYSNRPDSDRQDFSFQIIGIKSSMPRPGHSRWREYYNHNKEKINLLGRKRLNELERYIAQESALEVDPTIPVVKCFETIEIKGVYYCLLAIMGTTDITSASHRIYSCVVQSVQIRLAQLFDGMGTAPHMPGWLHISPIMKINSEFIEKYRVGPM